MRGAVCKSYEVWGQLSQGGMGDVWLARHRDLALPVVLKTLRPVAEEPLDARYQRLLHEARLSARLTSPRVVRVLDVGIYLPNEGPCLRDEAAPRDEATTDEPLPYLVEEYVDGIDMAEFDRRRRAALRRPLPLWAVADIGAQAADGLHAAHQAGVVHCDVKPSNLFGHQHAQLKVGDFGVAVASASDGRRALGGTPLFMAPEQLVGDEVDRRTDVYGLGAALFALRYGRPPYDALTDALRAEGGPRFPPARTPEEAYFQHVLARLLARRPDARYAQMTHAKQHLRALAMATMPRRGPLRVGAYAFEVGPAIVSFEVGDLALVESDALVNSAQSSMEMRSSVSDALRRRGGDELEAAALALGPRALGDCVATGAGRLPGVRAVLHAVGGWQEVSCVTRATHRALLLAEELGCTRVALPAIATGRGGVTVECCADAMIGAVRTHLSLGGSTLRELRVVLYTQEVFRRFVEVATGLLLGSSEAGQHDDALDAPPGARDSGSEITLFAHLAGGSTPPPAPHGE